MFKEGGQELSAAAGSSQQQQIKNGEVGANKGELIRGLNDPLTVFTAYFILLVYQFWAATRNSVFTDHTQLIFLFSLRFREFTGNTTKKTVNWAEMCQWSYN